MKLLRIKSYLIGFIVVMISLFSFNNNTYAYQYNFTYNGKNFSIEQIKSTFREDFPNYTEILDRSYFELAYIKDNKLYLALTSYATFKYTSSSSYIGEKGGLMYVRNNSYIRTLSYSNGGYVINNQYSSGGIKYESYFLYSYDFNNQSENFERLSGSTKTYFPSRNDNESNIDWINRTVVYTNLNFNPNYNTNSTENNFYRPFDDEFIDVSKIKLTKTYANDLDGTDLYNIRADFADIYFDTYTYQFKTDFFNDWVDITENIQTAAQEGYYIYDYSCYYNTNIHFRVLNNSGEVLDKNSINVSELNNFGMQISHNFATDLEGRDIYAITIDLRNCWENSYKYQYSYDNKNFYNMDVSEENKIYYLNHGINIPIYFQILDSNNNILWNTKYNGPFDNINKNIELKEFTGTDQSGNKFIGFEADLSDYTQFSDIYNFKVIINGIQQDLKDVIAWNIRENQFDNYNIDFELYLDELLIEKFNYNPKLGFDSFDDKYNDIVNNEMEEEINNGDYTSIDGIFEAVKSFINAISDFINSFFKLIMVFFNRLNLWIKSAVIGIFIVMVVCRIIKAVRK